MRKTLITAGVATAIVLAVGGGVALAAGGSTTPAATPSATTSHYSGNGNDNPTAAPAISREQAEKTALAQVPGGKVRSSELETEHGRQIWDVEVAGTDGKEHEVSIDAGNGAVIASKSDDEDDTRGTTPDRGEREDSEDSGEHDED